MQTMMQPGELEPPRGEIPFLFLPRRDGLFAARSRRFQALAEKHSLGDYLRLMGRLAQAQQEALDAFPELPLPSSAYLEQCRQARLPPFGVLGWQRESAWRDGLQRILATMATETLPAAAGEAIASLRRCGDDELETYATRLLHQDLAGVPAGAAPFVAGALQVYWTALASGMEGKELPRLEQGNLCPVCGSPPVAAIIRSGGNENGLRYLCCSLCSSQWHKARGICSNCDAVKGITYYGIEGGSELVTAESCDGCHTYLKIVKLDKDPEADPQTDDLAMLTLDLLLEQKGYGRNGFNPLFHPGRG